MVTKNTPSGVCALLTGAFGAGSGTLTRGLILGKDAL
jgi:tRNA A37 threonylcarbamoyladenosine biosynthesis protein TsaE